MSAPFPSRRGAFPAPSPSRPAIAWLPQWLDGGALATLGPLVSFVVAVACALAIAEAATPELPPGRVILLIAFLAVPLAALVFWFPHWWAWRVCGPRGKGPLLGAALWLAKFPPKAEGEATRVLAASVLSDESYLGLGRAGDGLGMLALALAAARSGAVERCAELLPVFRQLPKPGELLARLVRGYALEALVAELLRRGEPRQALAWAERGRGRAFRHLRLLARLRLAESGGPGGVDAPVSTLGFNLARLLSPYRRDPLAAAAPTRSPAWGRLDFAAAAPARLHLELLANAGTGSLTSEPVQELARRWSERLTPQAEEDLAQRAAELGDPSPAEAVEEWRAGLQAELGLLAGAAQGAWRALEEGPFRDALRDGRAAPLHDLLQRELQPFVEKGEDREREGSLVELDRWLGVKLAAERLAELEGEEALAALWLGGLRYAACSWPIRVWNGEGERGLVACCLMSRWCAELAERHRDEEIAAANREMLGRCRRRFEREGAEDAAARP